MKVIINRRTVKHMKCAILAVFAAALVSSCAGVTENQTGVGEKPVTAEMVLNSSPLAEGITNEDVSQVCRIALFDFSLFRRLLHLAHIPPPGAT